MEGTTMGEYTVDMVKRDGQSFNGWMHDTLEVRGADLFVKAAQVTVAPRHHAYGLLMDLWREASQHPVAEPSWFAPLLATVVDADVARSAEAGTVAALNLVREHIGKFLADNVDEDGDGAWTLDRMRRFCEATGVDMPRRKIEATVTLVARQEVVVEYELPFGENVYDFRDEIVTQAVDEVDVFDWTTDEDDAELEF